MLNPTSAWCAEHLEAFRARWPAGYLTATLILFERFVRNPDVSAYCHADASKLGAAVAEFGPLCCSVDSDLRARVVAAALVEDVEQLKALRDEARSA